MINIDKMLVSLFEEKGINLIQFEPEMDAILPCITYQEVNNINFRKTETSEYCKIRYSFTVTVIKNSEDLYSLVTIVDDIMSDLGFSRLSTSPIIKEFGVDQRTIDYGAIISDNGRIYDYNSR